MNRPTFHITRILLFLFSISLALGTWNPFVPFRFEAAESGGFDLSQIISVLFIVSLAAQTKLKVKGKNNYASLSLLFFLAILLSTLVNSLFSGSSPMTMSTVIIFLKLALVLLLCNLLPQLFCMSPKLIYQSAFLFSIVCAILSVLYSLGYLDSFLAVSKGRVFFWGENPNSTSSRYGLAFIFLLHLIIKNPLRWAKKRHALWLALPFILNLIMATGSRGSFLILLISIIVYLAYIPFRKRSNKWILAVILPVSIYFLIGFIAEKNQDYSLFDRLASSYEVGEDAGREELNRDAFLIFYDNPILGIGIQHFQEEMMFRFNEYRTVHNLYIYLLAVSGIVGFCCFIMFLWSLLKSSLKMRMYSALPLTLLVYITTLAYKTGGILTYMLMWYVFAIIIAFYNLYQNEQYAYSR